MTYYKVKPQYDQMYRKNLDILVANELYTEKELKRFEINPKYCAKIEINKNNTYFSFGVRFEM